MLTYKKQRENFSFMDSHYIYTDSNTEEWVSKKKHFVKQNDVNKNIYKIWQRRLW